MQNYKLRVILSENIHFLFPEKILYDFRHKWEDKRVFTKILIF